MASTATQSERHTWNERNLLTEAAARQFGYSLLKRTFIESPNADYAKAILDEGILDAVPFRSASRSVDLGLKAAEAELSAASDERILELGDDYMQLFVGPGKLPAPPWEAVYRSEKRRVFQKETVQVRRAYEAYKLQPEKLKKEPDDHIALEVDFMGRLCGLFIDAVKEKKYTRAKNIVASQSDFHNEHLLKWVTEFCDDVRANADTEFYRGMANVLEGYVAQDSQYCIALLDAVKEKIRTERKKKTSNGSSKKKG